MVERLGEYTALTFKSIYGSGRYMVRFSEHNRQSLRLPTYDYSQSGAYFVTLCAFERKDLFGNIKNGAMLLNEYGKIVADEWVKSSVIRTEIVLDEWVIMPNHFHAIVWIRDSAGAHGVRPCIHAVRPCIHTRGARRAPLRAPLRREPRSVSSLIAGFKSAVTKHIYAIRNDTLPVWQRNYYERIIRSERELFAVRRYIVENPLKWEMAAYS